MALKNTPLIKSFLPLLIVIALVTTLGRAAEAGSFSLEVGRFSQGELSGWSEREFKERTRYSLVEEGGRMVLRAESRGSASCLYRKVRVEPGADPLLTWSWKIEGIVPGGDLRTKAGDDSAARMMVFFGQAWSASVRAVIYTWANTLPRGSRLANAYLGRSRMIVLRSGAAEAGLWLREERSPFSDFRELFKEAPPPIGAVALMTDSDDTRTQARAWFGDIGFKGKR